MTIVVLAWGNVGVFSVYYYLGLTWEIWMHIEGHIVD